MQTLSCLESSDRTSYFNKTSATQENIQHSQWCCEGQNSEDGDTKEVNARPLSCLCSPFSLSQDSCLSSLPALAPELRHRDS